MPAFNSSPGFQLRLPPYALDLSNVDTTQPVLFGQLTPASWAGKFLDSSKIYTHPIYWHRGGVNAHHVFAPSIGKLPLDGTEGSLRFAPQHKALIRQNVGRLSDSGWQFIDGGLIQTPPPNPGIDPAYTDTINGPIFQKIKDFFEIN